MDRQFEKTLEDMREQGLDNVNHLFEVFVKATGVTTHVHGGMISGFLNSKDYDIKYEGPNTPDALASQDNAPKPTKGKGAPQENTDS